MKRRILSAMLAAALLISLCPSALAAGELYENRYLISETEYTLAPGITEYVTTTNNASATDQNIDYFCEVDPDTVSASVMACYPDYDGSRYKMQNVLDQAAAAQASFDRRGLDYKVVGIINADYYNMTTGEPTGALVMEGEVYHPAGYEPYFAILKDGSAVIRDSSIPLDDVQTAIGGPLILVRDGEIAIGQDDPYKVTRSAIGIKADGTIVTMVNHGKNYPLSCGYTPYQMAQMMKARGCVDALLLDGSGSSSHASVRAGDAEIIMRNEPSDGSPRHVSSSLLLVTTATPTGVFDRAVISPVNEVYTPGSEVQFSFVAVDSSNTPVEEVPALTWRVQAGCAGTIDANTGRFLADGDQTGDVTVELIDETGQVRGESTILVQNPDKIYFETDPVSIGFGDTSDLGLAVRYENREVHYKDGDFNWEIQPTEYVRKQLVSTEGGNTYETITVTDPAQMGDLKFGAVEDNRLTCLLEYLPGTDSTERRASTAKATVTVTSVKNPAASGSVTVEAGKEPAVIMGFEDYPEADGSVTPAEKHWTIGTTGDDSGSYLVTSNYGKGGTVGAELASRADGYPVHSGSYSLKLDYSFNDPRYPEGVSATEGACFGFRDEMVIEGNPTALGMWVYVPEGTPNYWLRLQYTDGSGRTTQLDFTKQYKDAMAQDGNVGGVAPYADGTWHYFEADLTGLQAPLSIPAGMIGRLMVVPAADNFCGKYLIDGTEVPVAEREGSIYFDDIMFIYGSNPNDTNLPEVTSFTVNQAPLTDGMTLTDNELSFYAEYKDGNTLQDLGIDYDNIFLYVDGSRLENTTVDQGGNYIRRDSVRLANGWHSVKLVVTDKGGNERVLNYRIFVDAADSQATSVYLKPLGTPQLGKPFSLELRTTCGTDIQNAALSLAVDKAYRNAFTVTAAEGFEIQAEPVYDIVNHTIEFTVQRTGETTDGDVALATITFDIPANLLNGSGFSYSVDAGTVTYTDGYDGGNDGLFGSQAVRLPIEVAYQITSDCFVAGLKGTYFYIKDAEGQPVSGVELTVDGAETRLGPSDAEGKILYEPTQAGTITVQTEGSFAYTATVNTAAGETDGAPEMILHTAVDDITTQRTVTWLSNPLYSAETAQMKLSQSEDMSGAELYSGSSELLEFVTDTQVARANAVQATGLVPGATYYYQLGDGAVWSEVQSFKMPSDDDTLPKRILLMADIQDPESTTPDSLLQSLQTDSFDLLIQTGDLVDNGGSYAQRKAGYAQLAAMGDINRIYALGNHEKYGDDPGNISHTLNHTGDAGYYSVAFGNLYLAVIDYGVDYERALQWMVEDASQSDAKWKMLITHQPAYYTNADGGNAEIHDLLPAYAEQAGIDLVFSGHDHTYSRTKSLTGGEVDEKNGIIYVISGAVGDKGYPISSNLPFADCFEVCTDQFDAAYLTLEIHQGGVQVTAYNYTGAESQVLDQFNLACSHGEYAYDLESKQLLCTICGQPCTDKNFTGEVSVKGNPAQKVYFYLGELRTGWFLVGDEWYHAGTDGILHDVITTTTATCTEYGYRVGTCNTCGQVHQGDRLNPTGHDWDENHVCRTCGFHGIHIDTLDIKLNFTKWPWTGEPRWPIVTVKDGDKVLTRATSIGSGVGDYYLMYPTESEVGKVSLIVMAMDASNYYGQVEVPYQIVPPQVENLMVAELQEDSVTLKWDPAHGATYYRISYYNEAQGGYYFRWQTSNTELTIDGLKPGTDYSYRVRAYAQIDGEEYEAWSSSNAVYVTPGTSSACEADGHQYVEEEVAPSCEFGGGIRYTCSVCGSSYTEIRTAALGHKAVKDPAVPATCTEPGMTEGSHCSACGEILVAQEAVDALGHDLKDAQPVDEMNHSGICARCQQTITEPHIWDEGVVVTPATASQTGEMRYTCTVCQATKTEPIPRPSGSGGGGSATYAISVKDAAHGKVVASERRASDGDKVVITVQADAGYVLDTLTVTDSKGNELKLTEKNGEYSFTMPRASVTVRAVFAERTAPAAVFTDVAKGDWFYDAVQYVCENDMMQGVGGSRFAPDSTLTRAMVAQILYNLEERPDGSATPFADVKADAWYADAVRWAADAEIVQGYGPDRFGPENPVTREQLAQMLYRYAAHRGDDLTADSNALAAFTDRASVSDWAEQAMAWAVSQGLISGKGNGILDPDGTATRAEVAAIFMRLQTMGA